MVLQLLLIKGTDNHIQEQIGIIAEKKSYLKKSSACAGRKERLCKVKIWFTEIISTPDVLK